jgi:hypothetical protein
MKNIYNWKITEILNDKFPRGWAGYNCIYTLMHPWILITYTRRQIQWAWQRVFRGWDDRVIWSIDFHLADVIPDWFQELKNDKMGIPTVLFQESDYLEDGSYQLKPGVEKRLNEEYNKILDKISCGFAIYNLMEDCGIWENDPYYPKLRAYVDEAFDLLKQYFGTFWD